MSESKKEVVEASCCGGPAPEKVDACCVKDADAKASGEPGCACVGVAEQTGGTSGCCG